MWITYDKDILKPTILIDCRSKAFNTEEITPTYKLAKKHNIIRGNIFSVDSLFFALYFLKDFDNFKNSSAVIYTDENQYFLSNKKASKCYQIEKIGFLEKLLENNFDWMSNSLDKLYKKRGLVKLDKGYIIIRG